MKKEKLYNNKQYVYDKTTSKLTFMKGERFTKKLGGSSFYNTLPELKGGFSSDWNLYIGRTSGLAPKMLNSIHTSLGNKMEESIARVYIYDELVKNKGYKIIEEIYFEPADWEYDYFGKTGSGEALEDYSKWFQGIPDAWVLVEKPNGEQESIMLEIKTAGLKKLDEWSNPKPWSKLKYGTSAEYVKQLQSYMYWAKALNCPIYKPGIKNTGVIVATFFDKWEIETKPTTENTRYYEIEREEEQIIKDLAVAKQFRTNVLESDETPTYDGTLKNSKFFVWSRYTHKHLAATNEEERKLAQAEFLADWFLAMGKGGGPLQWEGDTSQEIIDLLTKLGLDNRFDNGSKYSVVVEKLGFLGEIKGYIIKSYDNLEKRTGVVE